MINVKMTSSEGVILATSGKYCTENIKVVPDFLFAKNIKSWDITIRSDINERTVVLTDEWLAAHYDDDGLMVVILPMATAKGLERMLGGCFCSNSTTIEVDNGKSYGALVTNSGSSQIPATNIYSYPLKTSHDSSYDIHVSKTGDLDIFASKEYSICAGKYKIIAFLRGE